MTREDDGDTSPQPIDEVTQVMPVGSTGHLAGGAGGHSAPPGTLFDEFELIRVIGEGGFGIVYEARDRVLLRHVAVKEYMPASLASRKDKTQIQVRSQKHQEAFDQGMRSFINEARLLVRFDHPSLVKAHRFWEANGTAYMVMPLYQGATLKQRLKLFDGQPTEDWLMAMLDPLTEALHVLHLENCFHRDIAPDNILLLEEDERPVLLDFGAARQVIGDLTQSLTAILKPGFAPVEQYASSSEFPQGPWTDAYALAATIHFAITGSTPPPAVGRLVKDTYVPLASGRAPSYSLQFLSALDRALGVMPRGRTASMVEFRADLGLPLLGARTIAMSRTVLENHHSQPSNSAMASAIRVNSWRFATIGGLTVLGAGIVVAALWRSGRIPEPSVAAPPVQEAVRVEPPPLVASSAAAGADTPTLVGNVPTAFDVGIQFQRIVSDQTPGFVVTASATQPVFKIGKDRFGWQIRSERDGHVQILWLGPDGTLLHIFPNRKDRDNRIRAGQTLSLPRNSWPLQAAEPEGREELLVVVSAQPRAFNGRDIKRNSFYLQLPVGEAAAAAQAAWPLQTPWLLGAVFNCTGEGCDDYGAAIVTMEVRH